MQYILTQEELNELVPKKELLKVQQALKAVIDAVRKTDFCDQHKYGPDEVCDECPISSLNLKSAQNYGYIKPCEHQHFSQ